jgi:very-short-patch-repair endonuclease
MWAFLTSVRQGRRGKATLRELLTGRDDRDEKVRSRFEAKMLSVLRRIPEFSFVANYELLIQDTRYFLDFYCEPARLGIECHSFRWHMGRHVEDMRRDRKIRSIGIELLYFSWDDVSFHADDVQREIQAALARRMGTSQQRLSVGP